MILEEITLGNDEESKRKAIHDNLGQYTILNDFHEAWCHCQILKEGYDNEVYQIQIGNGRGKRQLHYHDLNQLIIIRNYPIPKLRSKMSRIGKILSAFKRGTKSS